MTATAYTTTSTSAQRMATALTVLRVVVGIVFLVHGGQKLFVFGFGGTIGFFTQVGIPLPTVTGPLVALVEFFGGLALIAGLLTRLAALGLAIDMLGAILLVHLKGGFFLPNGFEYALTLLAATTALALAGPGAYAADDVIAARRAGTVRIA